MTTAEPERVEWRELTALRRLADDVQRLLAHGPAQATARIEELYEAYDRYNAYRLGLDQPEGGESR